MKDRINQYLWPDDIDLLNVYVILDAARSREIYESVLSSHLEWVCLYSGNIPRQLAMVAPYLVKLQRAHFFTDFVIEEGWGQSWGIFLRSTSELGELRKHFHSFLTVETEEGKRMVFRYYDPRVLRVYLPTCNLNELATVFGPTERFILEDQDPSNLIDFQLVAGRLITQRHSPLHAFVKKTAAEENLTP